MDGNGRLVFVGGGRSDTHGVGAANVGSKGFNLVMLDRLGLPVPPAVVWSTEFFPWMPGSEEADVERAVEVLPVAIRRLENATGTMLGSRRRPLVVSVRSSPPVSMPGMLDSVLNVGLTPKTVPGLIRLTGNPRLAWDAYRRLVEAFALAGGVPRDEIAAILAERLAADEAGSARELDSMALEEVAVATAKLAERHDAGLPADPVEQLAAAMGIVVRSWRGARADKYRRMNGLDETTGLAVVVQAMVFGNAGGRSGSGVGFTRDPATGEDVLYLDFLFNAQGDDVVGGGETVAETTRLREVLPDIYGTLDGVRHRLERELGDVQDFEFTVQDGQLYFLQTRSAKRTPWAALRVAIDAVAEGRLDPEAALASLNDHDVDGIVRSRLVPAAGDRPIATATPAGTGVAVGAVALDSQAAAAFVQEGRHVVFVRERTSPDDIEGLSVADGMLTAAGGRTCHAAVVARQLGKVCLVACEGLAIDLTHRRCTLGDRVIAEGEEISLDGDRGLVYAGCVEVRRERPEAELRVVESWRRAGRAARETVSAAARG